MVQRPRPGIRLTDADREHAARRVREAHIEGRLTLEELDQRLAIAYGARFAGDLEPALHDLPTDRERALLTGWDPGPQPVVGLSVPRPLVLEGSWTVPRRVRIGPREPFPASRVRLDLRAASVPHPEVDLVLDGLGILVQIVLPPGGTADLSALRGLGRPRTAVPAIPAEGKVHLVVSGSVVRRRMVRVGYELVAPWWDAWTM